VGQDGIMATGSMALLAKSKGIVSTWPMPMQRSCVLTSAAI
jgi:hypothetical protein